MKQETINKIRELSKDFSNKEIAKKLNVSLNIVRYYLDNKYRKYRIGKANDYYKKLPKEKKKELQKKRKEYFRVYFNQRYDSDKEFRDKHKERVLKHYFEKYRTDEEFREKRLEMSREQYVKKLKNGK